MFLEYFELCSAHIDNSGLPLPGFKIFSKNFFLMHCIATNCNQSQSRLCRLFRLLRYNNAKFTWHPRSFSPTSYLIKIAGSTWQSFLFCLMQCDGNIHVQAKWYLFFHINYFCNVHVVVVLPSCRNPNGSELVHVFHHKRRLPTPFMIQSVELTNMISNGQ